MPCIGPPTSGPRYCPERVPAFRTPLPDLNQLPSPYLAGVLDAAEEQMLLLETTRGCVFKCKFCYYPKSYDKQYYLGADAILASLRHADERGAREVFLLDPTLNQRKDFAVRVQLRRRHKPPRRLHRQLLGAIHLSRSQVEWSIRRHGEFPTACDCH